MLDIRFREGKRSDSGDLAILADAAGRRVMSWIWDGEAEPGESSFDVGRTTIRSDVDSTDHHSKWRVVELAGEVAGGLNSYQIVASTGEAGSSEVVRPLLELKALAAGTWYVSVAAVFPELRGNGIGHAILAEAERIAAEASVHRMSLMVVSANHGARRLYERCGYRESERRTFNPFPGSDPGGDWILMTKDIQ